MQGSVRVFSRYGAPGFLGLLVRQVAQPDQRIGKVQVSVGVQGIVHAGCQAPVLAHRVINGAVFIIDGGGVVADPDIPAPLLVDLVLRPERQVPGILVPPIGRRGGVAQCIGVHLHPDLAELAPVLPTYAAQ
ncbi:hypothetical protein D3C81_1670620 [compost metagenome]